ncbi:MAG: O-antigen ligase family protein [Chloroflexi bacterium]|uniref:O-antigen ligase family protein n=1 Tax=Candidatus Chlorohelix allophototropha TaxID=3003348 RepID=A0A8T7LU06_9CHLR|nr:O-antigen ligase family protein [Chloroflexota bacterium]WJW66221.1 O-antigen ligase family protein [Chloroflexota bacterium L227-S17]
MTVIFNTIYRVRRFASAKFTIIQLVTALLVPLFLWLFITQPFYIAPAIIVGICAFLVIARYPQYGLYLMILSVPVQDVVTFPLGGGQTLTVTQVVVLLTLAAYFVNRCTFHKPFVKTPTPPLLKWFLVYIGAMIISLLTAYNLGEGLNAISRWLITFFAYLLATSVIETRRQFWQLVGVLAIGGIFEAALGILQTGLNLGPESFAISQDLSRAFGTFTFPNPFAGYLEMSLPIVVALIFLAWKLRNQSMSAWLYKEGQPRQTERKAVIRSYLLLLITLPSATIVIVAVVASYSRGAWLGLLVGVLVMIAVRGKKSLWVWLALVALVIFGGLGLQTGALSPSIATRITSIADLLTPFDVRDVVPNPDNYAVVERMAMWQAGGNMFLSNPFFGVGIGNFDVTYNMFNAPQWIYSRGHAHNYYIHAAAETGLVGLTAYLLLVISVFVNGWKTARLTCDISLRYVAWGALGIVSAVMFHNLVENLHVLNLGIQWCGVLALFYLVGKLDKERV